MNNRDPYSDQEVQCPPGLSTWSTVPTLCPYIWLSSLRRCYVIARPRAHRQIFAFHMNSDFVVSRFVCAFGLVGQPILRV